MSTDQVIDKLKQWFLETKRDLPWRCYPSPYAVWVSEIMLQQTQVSVVIPYFEKWMTRFPTIKVLAEASLDEVIKMWEGLGYYSRARNLHLGALQIERGFGGKLPSDPVQLSKIKGLGPYTVGAICSFAFHQKLPAVDGNVIRVLARFHTIEGEVTKACTKRLIYQMACAFLPEKEPWVVAEALIELGATICQSKPKCRVCPLKRSCKSYHLGSQPSFPVKKKLVKTEMITRAVVLIQHQGHYLVQKVTSGKVMTGLFEFAYFNLPEHSVEETQLVDFVKKRFGLDVQFESWLPEERHSFTRFRAVLIPARLNIENRSDVENFTWTRLSELKKLPFSSGHKRILNKLI